MRKGRREATEKTAGETGDTARIKKEKRRKLQRRRRQKAPRRPFRPRALREKKIFFFLPVLDSAHSLFSLSSSLFSSSLLFSSFSPSTPTNQPGRRPRRGGPRRHRQDLRQEVLPGRRPLGRDRRDRRPVGRPAGHHPRQGHGRRAVPGLGRAGHDRTLLCPRRSTSPTPRAP